jgi:ABC-type dipeptide/oligopeptide/nickel transport system ATPase component
MIASVIVDILSSNTDRVYDYTFSESQGIKKGQRVLVPFGGRKEEGIVIDIKENSPVDSDKLKSVIRVLEEIPLITLEMLELMYFMQSKYHILLAEALRLFIPSQLRGGRVSEKTSEEVYINPDIDYDEILKNYDTPISFLQITGDKDEISLIRQYLGNINFTRDEMTGPISNLSGGSKAKLFILKLILDKDDVLILDETTSNISPLSNPVIRSILKNYDGAIIGVSHDRKYISEVADVVYELHSVGLIEKSNA